MNEKKKIEVLIIPSWFPPDGGEFFKEHAESLYSEDFNISILQTRLIGLTSHSFKDIINSGRKWERPENSLYITGMSLLKLPWMEKRNVNRWVRKSTGHFKKYLERGFKPDLIMVQSGLWAGIVAARIKKEFGIPYILIEHRGRFINNNAASYHLKEWHREVYMQIAINASKIVCVSEALLDGLVKITGSREKLVVIPNMVDTDYFNLPVNKRENQPFIFLSIGTLEMVKGYDTLLKAFAEFTDKTEGEFFLRIGGKGGELKNLKALARDLAIEDRVSFTGHISKERVRDEMHRSNVFISSSRFESFGVALIEAASTGLPLIATKSGGPESIVNNVNGFTCQTDDPSSLEELMRKAYFNYKEFNQIQIRQETINQYSKNIISEKYHELIRNTLNAN